MAKVGRPTKYRPEYPKMMIEYFDVPATIEKEISHTNRKGETWTEFVEAPNNFPTFEGFACKIWSDVNTMLGWVKIHPEFSVSYTRARQKQADILAILGAKGFGHSNFLIFLAKNMTAWRDVQEIKAEGLETHLTFIQNAIEKAKDVRFLDRRAESRAILTDSAK